MNQDELLDMIVNLIRELDCRQLKLWLITIKFNRDPRQLPYYQSYAKLFTESSSAWPVMHLMTKITFDDLAQLKLELECS